MTTKAMTPRTSNPRRKGEKVPAEPEPARLFGAPSGAIEPGPEREGELALAPRGDPLGLRPAKVLEHVRAEPLPCCPRPPRHDVEVEVPEPLCLGELREVGLLAAELVVERPADALDERPEVGGLRRSELDDRLDVAAGEENEPPLGGRVEGVGDPPGRGDEDPLALLGGGAESLLLA